MKKKQLSLTSSSLRKYSSLLWRFWVRYFRFFLGFLFLLALLFVGYVWYQNLYNLDGNAQDRSAQLEQRTQEVKFDETSFNNIIERVNARREEMMQKTENVNDIFFPNQQPAPAEDQKESSSEAGNNQEDIEQTQPENQIVETIVEELDESVEEIDEQAVSVEDPQEVDAVVDN